MQDIHKTLWNDYKKHFKKVIYNLNTNRVDKFKDFVGVEVAFPRSFKNMQDEIKNASSLRVLKAKNEEYINSLLRI